MKKLSCTSSALFTAVFIFGFLLVMTPYALASGDTNAKISAGTRHTMAIRSDGSLWAWGYNNLYGALGDGTLTSHDAPIKIMDSVRSVSAGDDNTMAIKTDGSLLAWGNNYSGKLGDGTTTNSRTPVKIMDSVRSISAGGNHTLAIKTDGSLWAWGSNGYGYLGDGTTTSRYSPVKIMDSVVSVSAGTDHTMAIKNDGSLWAWGHNGYTYGELGDGTTTNKLSPIKIMDSVAYVSAGYHYTLAIKTDGSLWAWGWNQYGKLGDGTTTSRYNPVKIMDSVASVSAGRNHAMAVKADGSLWAWGDNTFGELGDGTSTDSYTPVKIMDAVASVSAGDDFSMAIKTDGSFWSWGSNSNGALGDGTNTRRLTPVQIFPPEEPDMPPVNPDDITRQLLLDGDAQYISSDNSILLCTNVKDRWGRAIFPYEIVDDFQISFDFKMGGGTGGDGIVFAFFAKINYSPTGGGAFAFNGSEGYGVEFDTVRNVFDPAPTPHIALIRKDVYSHLLTAYNNQIMDGSWHNASIIVIGNNITVAIDNNIVINHTENFDRSNKHMFFGSATGDQYNNHYIRNVRFNGSGAIQIHDDLYNNENSVDPDATYIYVVDGDGKNGVPGASVSLGSQTEITKANGLATFYGVAPGVTTNLTVASERYITYSNPYFTPELAVQQPATIYKDNGKPRIVSAPLLRQGRFFVSDVLTMMETFKERSANEPAETFQLNIAAISSGGSVNKCELFQEGNLVKAVSGSYLIFMLSERDFKPELDIYARVTDSSGNTSAMTKLQIKIAQNPFIDDATPKVSFGSTTGFTVPGNIPYIGGSEIKLDLGFIPMQVDFENNKIRVGIGTNKKIFEKTENGYQKEDPFKELKDIIDMYNDFNSGDFDKWVEKIGSNNFIGNIKFYYQLTGYAEGTIKDGQLQTCMGKILFKAGFKNTTEYQTFFVIPVVITVGFDVNGQFSGEVKLDFSTNKLTPQADLKFELKLEARGGVGVAYVASVGAYGEAIFSYTRKFKERYNLASFEGGLGGYAKVLFFDYKIPLVNLTYNMDWYDGGASTQSSANSFSGLASPSLYQGMYDTANYAVSSRDYLSGQSEWLGENIPRTRGLTSGVKTLQSSVYTETAPLFAEAGGDRVMVFIADDGSRDRDNHESLNRTILMYSLYNGLNDTWSEPQPVWEDGTADFYPDIYSDGVDIFVAWNNFRTVLANETSLESAVSAMETAVAKFDPITKTFIAAGNITNDDLPDIRPQIAVNNGAAFVAWVKSGSGDIFSADAADTVMYSEYSAGAWSEPNILASGLNAVVAMNAGYLNGQADITYITDQDNDLSTADDRDLIVSSDFTAPIVVVESAAVSNPAYAYIDGIQALTWYGNGNINYSYSPGNTLKLFEESREGLSDNYRISSDVSGNMAVIYPASDGIYGYLHDVNGWSGSVSLLKTDDHVRFPDGILETDGNIYFAFNQAHIAVAGDDFSETNDLRIYRFSPSANARLNAVYYPHDGVKAGASLPVGLDVANLGSKTINGFNVTVSSASGTVDQFTVYETVLPGEKAILSAEFHVPANLAKKTDFTVSILPLDDADSDESDNSVAITLGYVDLALSLKQYYIGNDSMIIVNISNNSDFPVTDAALLIRENATDGPVLKTMGIRTLGAFETTGMVALVYTDNIGFDGSDGKVLFFEVVSGEEELVAGNNNDFILIKAIAYVEEDPADAQAVAADKAALTWNVIAGLNPAENNVMTNLALPSGGANGTIITWHSNNTAVVSNGGGVTRPVCCGGDATVTLTAIISKGVASDVVVFNLVVKEMEYAEANVSNYADLQFALSDFETATGNMVVNIEADFSIDAVFVIPANANDKSLTIRSADPANPVTLTRGINNDCLFIVSVYAKLILENIIVDGDMDAWPDNGIPLVCVNGGEFIMNDGAVLTNNAASQGGAIHIAGHYIDDFYIPGVFTMNGGAISGNVSSGQGGGVSLADGEFIMNGGVISGNTTSYGGAGVFVSDGEFTMNGGKIAGNTSYFFGGGVYALYGGFAMNGGEITENTASENGGGVHGGYPGTLTFGGAAVISNNTREGAINNVSLLGGQYITIGTGHGGNGVDAPVPGMMHVGVTKPSENGVIVLDGANPGDEEYFHADEPGMEIIHENGQLRIVEGKDILYGDVNGDGYVNLLDIMALSRSLANWEGAVINNEKAADADADNNVTVRDLLVLRRHFANWTGYETLPWQPQQASPLMASLSSFTNGAQPAVPAINVSSVTGKIGDIVDVKISLSDNPGIIAMRLGVKFDDSVLRLVEAIDSGMLGNRQHQNRYGASPYMLFWENGVSSTNFTSSGDVVTFRFEILSETAGSPVTIFYDGAKFDVLDVNLKPVHFEVNGGSVSTPWSNEAVLVGAFPSASVKKLNGNKNDLTVSVMETFSDGSTNTITETFSINNNAAGSYRVGSYVVYVDTKGNDQIRQCHIVN